MPPNVILVPGTLAFGSAMEALKAVSSQVMAYFFVASLAVSAVGCGHEDRGCAYLSWKSAQYLDLHDSEGHVPGAWRVTGASLFKDRCVLAQLCNSRRRISGPDANASRPRRRFVNPNSRQPLHFEPSGLRTLN